ncbi:MAG: hypothetical protein MK229_04170 [Nitrososphaerales archaeon]|nr:hypothetical protein [Nitrososphaerales archaeon]
MSEDKRLKKREKNLRRKDHKKHKKRSKQIKLVRTYSIYVIAILLVGYGLFSVISGPQIGPVGSTHEHLDVLVYIDGEPLDLNQSRYAMKSGYGHIHGGEGDIMHLHAINIPLSWFMESIDLSITPDSIDVHGMEYSTDENNVFLMFVNGDTITKVDYVLADEDRILIYYGSGSDTDIDRALSLVSNRAEEVNGMPNKGD